MGFYGNITNTNKTQFTFDRTYPSRAVMEDRIAKDLVYLGRYVLVEYDLGTHETLDTFVEAKRSELVKAGTLQYYLYTGEGEALTKIRYVTESDEDIWPNKGKDGALKGQIIYETHDEPEVNDENPRLGRQTFYMCVDQDENGYAIFDKVVNSDIPYTNNYNIDTKRYGESRGYDSTVWQKVYTNGAEKFIMIAELNTVVPNFYITSDAPTMTPVTPHFDINSTNVAYFLHAQPQWGLRLKSANPISLESEDGNKFIASNDENTYPSDYSVTHEKAYYDPVTGQQSIVTKEYPAAFYYNKAGFDAATRTYYGDGEFNTSANGKNEKNENVIYDDEISILPTGYSGNKYNTHNPGEEQTAQIDTQEIKILLPAIGNAISDVWDRIYDYNKDEENKNKRYRDVAWKDAYDIELDTVHNNAQNDELGGMTRNLETVAGCINSVHDLMGMIITDKKDEYLNEEWHSKHYIYKDGDNKYYRIYEYPVYSITDEKFTLPTLDFINSDQEYNTKYNELLSFDHDHYYITSNDGESFVLINNNAIPNLQAAGVSIYYNSGVDYKYVEIPDVANKLNTIHGLLLEFRTLLNTDLDSENVRDFNTLQGIKNSLLDIINLFNDLIPGHFVIVDKEGNIESANWTTKQPFKYTEYGKMDAETSKEDIEDRWIKLSLDEENNLITLQHIFNEVDSTTTISDKNIDSLIAEQTGNNRNDIVEQDKINLYTPIVDNMGHVIGHNIETVTLPFGYKTFKTDGLSVVNDDDLHTEIVEDGQGAHTSTAIAAPSNIVADNTQDIFTVTPVNKWIQTQFIADNDELQIAHEIHAIPTDSHGTTNINKESGAINENNINIPDWKYDKAGHIIEKHDHFYTLPFGFKTITTNGTTEVVTNMDTVTEPIVADTTQDTLAINSFNRWIRLANNANADSIAIAHEVNPIPVESNGTTNANAETGAINENNINIPDWSFDEAGHITGKHDHHYTLPFGVRTMRTNGRSGEIVENASGIPATSDVIAETTQDVLTINSGNKWIRIDTNADNDSLTIRHDVHTTSSDPDTPIDWTKTEANTTIPVTTYNYDEAGHYVKHHTQNYQLPFGYGKIKGDNDTATAATATYDELTFGSDAWLTSTVTSDKVVYSHNPPVQGTATTKSNVEPAFGATFILDDHHFDANGHKFTSTTHTVKIPALSLTSGVGNIVTGITLPDPTNGQFIETKANVGSLLMTDYAKPTALSNQNILASESLNTAIGKLEYRLEAENARAVTAEENLSKRIDSILDGVTEEELNTFKELSDALHDDANFAATVNNAIASEITARSDADTAINQLLTAETQARTDADIAIIETLEALPAYGIKNEDIDKWNGHETNVKSDWLEDDETSDAFIKNKPDVIETSTTFNYTDAEGVETQKTIAELFAYISTLEARIKALEPVVEEPTPEEEENI